MKQTLITAAMLLFAAQAQVSAQSITVNNTTGCSAKVFLYAEDNSFPCMGLESKPFQVLPGSSQTYTSIFDIQDPLAGCMPVGGSGRGWFVPSNPYCPVAPAFWDGTFIALFSGMGNSMYQVGEPCSGSPLTMTSMVGCGMGPATVQWDNTNYPNIVVKIY